MFVLVYQGRYVTRAEGDNGLSYRLEDAKTFPTREAAAKACGSGERIKAVADCRTKEA